MKIRLKCTSMKNFKVLGLMKVNVKRYFRNKYTYELKINFMLDTKDFN